MHPSAIYDSYLLLTMVMWLAIMQLFVCYIAFFAIDLHEHECHTQLLFARKKNRRKHMKYYFAMRNRRRNV